VGKPEGRRLLGDNFKVDLKRDRMGVAWTGLIWLRIATSGGALTKTAMNLQIAYNVVKSLGS
jgi:hypothetical protein